MRGHELACGAPPFVSDNPFELAGLHVREAIEAPSQHGSSLGLSGDALLLRFLAKSPSDRFQNQDEALQSIDDLRTPHLPIQAPVPPRPRFWVKHRCSGT